MRYIGALILLCLMHVAHADGHAHCVVPPGKWECTITPVEPCPDCPTCPDCPDCPDCPTCPDCPEPPEPVDPCAEAPGSEACCANQPEHESCQPPPDVCEEYPGSEVCCLDQPDHASCAEEDSCDDNPGQEHCAALGPPPVMVPPHTRPVPDWVAGLETTHWQAVNLNRIADVGAAPHFGYRYGAAPWSGGYGLMGITNDWDGGVWASGYGDAGGLCIWGGGHGGYGGSEVYCWDASTRLWVRVSEPYGSIVGSPAPPDNPITGTNPDGSPIAYHSRDHLVYDPAQNSFIVLGSALGMWNITQVNTVANQLNLDHYSFEHYEYDATSSPWRSSYLFDMDRGEQWGSCWDRNRNVGWLSQKPTQPSDNRFLMFDADFVNGDELSRVEQLFHRQVGAGEPLGRFLDYGPGPRTHGANYQIVACDPVKDIAVILQATPLIKDLHDPRIPERAFETIYGVAPPSDHHIGWEYSDKLGAFLAYSQRDPTQLYAMQIEDDGDRAFRRAVWSKMSTGAYPVPDLNGGLHSYGRFQIAQFHDAAGELIEVALLINQTGIHQQDVIPPPPGTLYAWRIPDEIPDIPPDLPDMGCGRDGVLICRSYTNQAEVDEDWTPGTSKVPAVYDAAENAVRLTVSGMTSHATTGELTHTFPIQQGEVWYQYRIKFSQTYWDLFGPDGPPGLNAGGAKQSILWHERSCSNNEQAFTSGMTGLPGMYEGCGGYGYSVHDYPGRYNTEFQPGGDTSCLRAGTDGTGRPCLMQQPEVWITYTIHADMPRRRTRGWAQVEGEDEIWYLDFPMRELRAASVLYTHIYQGGKNRGADHPDAHLWYQDIYVGVIPPAGHQDKLPAPPPTWPCSEGDPVQGANCE